MSTTTATLTASFEAIVGQPHVRPAGPADQVEGVQPDLVVAPGSTEEAAEILRMANDAGLAVIPRGGGTKLAWGNRPRQARLIISTERLNHLLEHAHGDMTATAEAGMPIAMLQDALVRQGQMLALDPAWPEHATLGGTTATDASGPLRVRYGTLRDLIIGIGVVLPDGTIARAGGKVVKNVAGYDLMKLWTGSLGTLGLITSVTLRLHPLPAATTTMAIDAPDLEKLQAFVLALAASTLTPTGVQMTSGADDFTVHVRLAGIISSVTAQQAALERMAEQSGLNIRQLPADETPVVWRHHATIYQDAQSAIVARISVLPASIAATIATIARVAVRLNLSRQVVLQANGAGLLRLDGANEQALLGGLGVVRDQIVENGGSLVVQQCPASIKSQIDVWGPVGDAQRLMRQIKEQFDPCGIMNPGRFIGGI